MDCGSSIESCSFSFGHLLQEKSQRLEILSGEKVIVCDFSAVHFFYRVRNHGKRPMVVSALSSLESDG